MCIFSPISLEKDKDQMENLLDELNKDNFKQEESKISTKKPEPIYNLYDFLFPGGKLAKLVSFPLKSREIL